MTLQGIISYLKESQVLAESKKVNANGQPGYAESYGILRGSVTVAVMELEKWLREAAE